jgi:lipase maturation factor 1
MELLLVWMAFLPRRWKILCFFLVTAWQIGVIASANYAFLNYLVLILAFLLLDDAFLQRFVPARWRNHPNLCVPPSVSDDEADAPPKPNPLASLRTAISAVVLTWIFYATLVPVGQMFWRDAPLPLKPLIALEPFRIANQYGLFAVMTPHRYEIEFQGSNDGQQWTAYPFRYKPQDVNTRPRTYAPYQPRFDWNLWFASLTTWQQSPIVPQTEERLLENDHDVLALFASNPFPNSPPKFVRAVLWQYWFSDMAEKRTQSVWWRRQLLGAYAPTITRLPDGRFAAVDPSTFDNPKLP